PSISHSEIAKLVALVPPLNSLCGRRAPDRIESIGCSTFLMPSSSPEALLGSGRHQACGVGRSLLSSHAWRCRRDLLQQDRLADSRKLMPHRWTGRALLLTQASVDEEGPQDECKRTTTKPTASKPGEPARRKQTTAGARWTGYRHKWGGHVGAGKSSGCTL